MEIGQDTFEESELEELRQLTIKHRRGQISDLDFEEQAAWLLRGRSFPILTNDPKSEVQTKQTNEPSKQKELAALTSCGERSRRARQSYIRKHKESKQESYVAKTIKTEKQQKAVTNTPPPLSSSINYSVSSSTNDRLINSSISNASISAVNKSLEYAAEEQKLKPVIYGLIATIILISSILTSIFYNKKKHEIVTINNLSSLLIAHDQNPNLPTLFGPVTVSECNALCRSKKATNCENSCRKLSFEMFPHRITISDDKPEILTEKLEKNCELAFYNGKKTSAEMKEPKISLFALDNLSLNELTEEFSKVSTQHEKIQKSPNDNKNLKNASTILCLRANEIISYIGAMVANGYKDHYAVAYYQLMQRAIANKNATRQIPKTTE